MYLSALDERIGLSICAGALNLFEERYGPDMGTQCGSQVLPGLLCHGDTTEIYSLIAPRPLVIEFGSDDACAPHESGERALTRIRRAYDAAGATDALVVDRFDGGHVFHGEAAFAVLDTLWK